MGSDRAVGRRCSLQSDASFFRRQQISHHVHAVAANAAVTAMRMQMEDHMPTFILSLNFTDQGIRAVKDAPKRSAASKELARKLGMEIKQVYVTTGASDILIIAESPSGDNVAKFALATSALGNVRTSTARAWTESEFQKL